MHIRLIAVGDRQPAWVDTAFNDYAERLPRQWQFRLDRIATAQRTKTAATQIAKETEAQKILSKIKPTEFVIALDENGRQFSSKDFGMKLAEWQTAGQDLVFVIGGPDGFANSCLERANLQWSLSQLTLPHGLARVLFVEQMYRAWSLTAGHPYHRE